MFPVCPPAAVPALRSFPAVSPFWIRRRFIDAPEGTVHLPVCSGGGSDRSGRTFHPFRVCIRFLGKGIRQTDTVLRLFVPEHGFGRIKEGFPFPAFLFQQCLLISILLVAFQFLVLGGRDFGIEPFPPVLPGLFLLRRRKYQVKAAQAQQAHERICHEAGTTALLFLSQRFPVPAERNPERLEQPFQLFLGFFFLHLRLSFE